MSWPLRTVFVCFCIVAISALCSAQIDLGAAKQYGILGRLSVTNTGPTVINGDLGTGGTSIIGFPPGVVNGNKIIGDATGIAFIDASAAFAAVSASNSDLDLTGDDLGDLNLPPGSYNFDSSAQLTGRLTLDGGGDLNAEWYFNIGTSLNTAVGSSIVFADGGSPCGVYWAVGSAATLGVGTSFVGTIMAGTSVTFGTGAVLNGRAFGLSATVTLDTNIITVPECPIASSSSSTIQGSSTLSTLSSSTFGSSSTMITTSTTISLPSTTTATISSTSVQPSSTSVSISTLLSSSQLSSSSQSSSLPTSTISQLTTGVLQPGSTSSGTIEVIIASPTIPTTSSNTGITSESTSFSLTISSLSISSLLTSSLSSSSISSLSSSTISSLSSSSSASLSTSSVPTSTLSSATSSSLTSSSLTSSSSLSFSSSSLSLSDTSTSSIPTSSVFLTSISTSSIPSSSVSSSGLSSSSTSSLSLSTSTTTSRSVSSLSLSTSIVSMSNLGTANIASTSTSVSTLISQSISSSSIFTSNSATSNTSSSSISTFNMASLGISTSNLSTSNIAPSNTKSFASFVPTESSFVYYTNLPTPIALQTIKTRYSTATEIRGDSGEAIITVIETIHKTLTSCPPNIYCTGQTSTWTGSKGPLPCSAFKTCTCVLPGGTKTLEAHPSSSTCITETTYWTGYDGPTACARDFTCSKVFTKTIEAPGGVGAGPHASALPTSAICSTQTTYWTGEKGPTACTKDVTCSATLTHTIEPPGHKNTGLQSTVLPTSAILSAQTTYWTGKDGPTACASGVTCSEVLVKTIEVVPVPGSNGHRSSEAKHPAGFASEPAQTAVVTPKEDDAMSTILPSSESTAPISIPTSLLLSSMASTASIEVFSALMLSFFAIVALQIL